MSQSNKTNNKPNKNISLKYLMTSVLFIASIPIIFYVLNQGKKIKVDPITIGIIAIMVVILIIEAFMSRRRMIKITNELRIAILSNDLKSYSFKNPLLNNAILKYNKDRSALKSQGIDVPPDISDYINEEIVSNYVHRELTDQIGSIMTGLGILGTFIGLTFGLEKFDSETALQSTPLLLNGIKIAFYTSIFGIIASLIYSHFYSDDIEKNKAALEDFYTCFYDKVSPNSETYLFNKILAYNKQQTDSLNALAGSIAGELAPKFAEAINQSVMPTMNKLNQSIDDYIMRAVDAQSKTLGEIVDKFMKQLNKSLDNQFDNLANSINQMCTYQNDSTDKLKSIFGSLEQISTDLSKLNVDMANAEENRKRINEGTSSMIDRASRFADAFNEHSQTVHAWTEELKKETDLNISYVESMKAYSDQITKDKTELMNELEKLIEDSKEYRNKIDDSISLHESKNSEIIEFVNNTLEQFNKYTSSTTETYKNSSQSLEKAIKSVVGSDKQLQENIENVTKQILNIESMTTTSSQQNNKYVEQMKSLISEIQVAWKEHSSSLNKVNNDYATIVSEIQNSYNSVGKEFTETIKNLDNKLSEYIDKNNKLVIDQILPAIDSLKTNK